MTKQQEMDAKKCEEMAERGEDKDCLGCSCNCCIADEIESDDYTKAIEMLKVFAFVDPDESETDRCNNAFSVQELLRELGYGKWVDEQIAENQKNMGQ